jgi:hypothetical protein
MHTHSLSYATTPQLIELADRCAGSGSERSRKVMQSVAAMIENHLLSTTDDDTMELVRLLQAAKPDLAVQSYSKKQIH